jgi:dihydroneopterin aldolase
MEVEFRDDKGQSQRSKVFSVGASTLKPSATIELQLAGGRRLSLHFTDLVDYARFKDAVERGIERKSLSLLEAVEDRIVQAVNALPLKDDEKHLILRKLSGP